MGSFWNGNGITIAHHYVIYSGREEGNDIDVQNPDDFVYTISSLYKETMCGKMFL